MITQLTEMFDIISRNLLCQKQYKQHFTKKLYLTHFNDKKNVGDIRNASCIT